MSEQYIKSLEKRNEEIETKLQEALLEIKKLGRKNGLYVVFKIVKTKIGKNWIANDEFMTICEDLDNVKRCIKYDAVRPPYVSEEDILIGYRYWKQPRNYRWAVWGTSKFYDTEMKSVPEITVDKNTGKVSYR